MNIMQVFNLMSQFKSNPMEIIGKRFNIPQGMSNPEDMVNHLINSGQVSQEQVNQAKKMQNLFRK